MTQTHPNEHAAPWYRSETWLVVRLASFIPVSIAIAAPRAWQAPLIGLSGALLMVSVVMLMRQYRLGRAQEPRSRVLSDSTPPPGARHDG